MVAADEPNEQGEATKAPSHSPNWPTIRQDIAGICAQFFLPFAVVFALFSARPTTFLPEACTLLVGAMIFFLLGLIGAVWNFVGLFADKSEGRLDRMIPATVAYALSVVVMLVSLVDENPLARVVMILADGVVVVTLICLWWGAIRSA